MIRPQCACSRCGGTTWGTTTIEGRVVCVDCFAAAVRGAFYEREVGEERCPNCGASAGEPEPELPLVTGMDEWEYQPCGHPFHEREVQEEEN